MSLTVSIPVVNEELGLVYLGLEYNSETLSRVEGFHLEITKVLEADENKKANNIYTCHICAKDLPAAFVKEHDESLKHKANLCITNEASRRTAKVTYPVPTPSVKPGGKFCKSCCVVEENNHEQTDEHRAAVKRDAMLCALVKTYIGQDYESDWSLSDTNSEELQENSLVYGKHGQENESDEDRSVEDTNESQKDNLSLNNDSPVENSGLVHESGDDWSLGNTNSEGLQGENSKVYGNHEQENGSDDDEYWSVDNTDEYLQDHRVNSEAETNVDNEDDIEANNTQPIQEAPSTSQISHASDSAPNQVLLIRRNDIPSCFRPTGINSRLQCIPCKCFVPSWPQNIEDHLRGQKHLRRTELYERLHY